MKRRIEFETTFFRKPDGYWAFDYNIHLNPGSFVVYLVLNTHCQNRCLGMNG